MATLHRLECEEDQIDDEFIGENEAQQTWQDLEILAEAGINQAEIKKLREAGINTVGEVTMLTKKQLSDIKGMSEARVEKVMNAAQKVAGSLTYTTGTHILEKRNRLVRITTGSKALDALLGGGIESGSITEAFGEFRSGKTQLAHTLCVTGQLPQSMGGGNGKVIVIDTEGTFRPDRIVEISKRFGVDPQMVLDNVIYARAHTHEQQCDLVTIAAAKMYEDHIAVIIVDSATALFRVDFCGRGQLAERQNKLGQFLSKLTKLADEFNVVVYITNQVVSDPGAAAMFVQDAKKPIGGHIMAHACCTRLMFRKGKGEQRVCKVYDSPNLAEAEATFKLAAGGVEDE